MSGDVAALDRVCSSCGQRIALDVYEAQADEGMGDSAMCRSCLEGVQSSPQLEQLYEQIEAALSDVNAEEWRNQGAEDRFYFALHCINEGIVEGGSPGFHDHLRHYVAWLVAEDKRAAGDGGLAP